MKYFIALLLVSAVASAKNINVKTAEARDSFHGSTSNIIPSSSVWETPVTTTFLEPAYASKFFVSTTHGNTRGRTQISANQGPNSRSVLEAIIKAPISKSS